LDSAASVINQEVVYVTDLTIRGKDVVTTQLVRLVQHAALPL
jgi:hypothetical protein